MNDPLDEFVKANRGAFDDKVPPETVWKNIQRTLPAAPVRWFDSLILWRAAAMVFMALSVYLMLPKLGQQEETSKVAVNEFNDVEAFYTTQISQKVAMIEQFSGSRSTEEFTQDFKQLEAMYSVLKEEWKSRPSKKVKDALVLNLLVRINLLNQQLYRLEEETGDEEKEDGSAKTSEI